MKVLLEISQDKLTIAHRLAQTTTMSSWDVKMNDGWSHTQPCSCSKCRPEPHPVSREKRLTWKQQMIRMNYKMREEAAVVIQKNFRMMVEVRKYRSLPRPVHCWVRDNPSMIVTPVAMGAKSASRRDWLEQVQRRQDGEMHVWDDSKQNCASKGDLFAYVENSVKLKGDQKSKGWIDVFVIKDVYSPEHRLPSWSDNVGQGDRNVVELSSEPIYSGTMVEWKEQLGYAERYCVQGTIHLSNNKISGYQDKIM